MWPMAIYRMNKKKRETSQCEWERDWMVVEAEYFLQQKKSRRKKNITIFELLILSRKKEKKPRII